jgi:hypothetical protein
MCYYTVSALIESLTYNMGDKMYSEQLIVNEVVTHMCKYAGKYQDWYAGVAANAKEKLFNDHGVKETGDAWICRDCVNDVTARQVERYFMKRGCKGGPVDEGESTRYFYAYIMQPHTRE